jgi:hypothetical protein
VKPTLFKTITLPGAGGPAVRVAPGSPVPCTINARVLDDGPVAVVYIGEIGTDMNIPGQPAPINAFVLVTRGDESQEFVTRPNEPLFAIGIGAAVRLSLIISEETP